MLTSKKEERTDAWNKIQEAEAEALAEKLRGKYPDLEVSAHNGGQPLYYYLISVE